MKDKKQLKGIVTFNRYKSPKFAKYNSEQERKEIIKKFFETAIIGDYYIIEPYP